jgi:hypothetical protein
MAQATLTRRAVVRGAAGAAAGLASAAAVPWSAEAHGERHREPVPPEPIPGGIALSPERVIHVWAPGPTEITLPFTGVALQGLDVEPTTIRDFKGFSAVAFHVGSAVAGDGTRFNLETDVRTFQGVYVDSTGTRRFGTFAFV